jgi:Fe2+ transport system protein FeoA
MIATLYTYPLCGHRFDPAAHLACQTCPLHTGCHLVCCPACGHTTVDQGQSRIVRWITALLDHSFTQQLDQVAIGQGTERVRAPECALADVPLDQRARVVDMRGLPTAQRDQLHGYGILPGCVLRILQRLPVTVVQIEHAELAIETEIAQAILVEELA